MTTHISTTSNYSANTTEAFNTTMNDTTTSPPLPSMEQFTLYQVTITINKYYIWVVFAFGFPGNLLSLLTILRMPTVSSSKMHVAMLAVVDNLAIVAKLLYHQLMARPVSLGHAGCKVSAGF